jgi:hypothetical protein
MRKTYIHFEQVPVEVAEKILGQESSPAKRGSNPKLVVKKSRRTAKGLHAVPKKVEVLVP